MQLLMTIKLSSTSFSRVKNWLWLKMGRGRGDGNTGTHVWGRGTRGRVGTWDAGRRGEARWDRGDVISGKWRRGIREADVECGR